MGIPDMRTPQAHATATVWGTRDISLDAAIGCVNYSRSMAIEYDPMTDHYVALGVGSMASHDEIKKAHRALIRELHPVVATLAAALVRGQGFSGDRAGPLSQRMSPTTSCIPERSSPQRSPRCAVILVAPELPVVATLSRLLIRDQHTEAIDHGDHLCGSLRDCPE